MLNRLRRRGVEVTTKLPRIAYRETIAGKSEVRYRHKKQTGGAGQFAECAIRIEPSQRGEGYAFIDKIFGGVISGPFRQSVDRGMVLLEPIVKLEVVIPSKYMGDITGDISSRRGRVIGMDGLGDLQVVHAEIPYAEVQQYSAFLQSVTGGEGTYSIEFLVPVVALGRCVTGGYGLTRYRSNHFLSQE
jgi:elongation factor G